MLASSLRERSLLVLMAACVLSMPVFAGTTGTLNGRVVNEKKEPLAGVNVRIEGQRLGAISDADGRYFIIGIPGGNHMVRANLLGHAPYVATNVVVNGDYDYVARIVAPTLAAYEALTGAFLADPAFGIARIHTTFVLKTLKAFDGYPVDGSGN